MPTPSSSYPHSENPNLFVSESGKGLTKAWDVSERYLKHMERESKVDPLYQFMVDYLYDQPTSTLIVIAFVILAGVGILNYLAGPDLSTWIFYLIPIFLVTWCTERWAGIFISIFSALTWSVADYASGTTYWDAAIPYWNGIARLGYFLVLTFILSALKNAIKKEKELSRIDFLTRVGNSRYFIELANMEINRACRMNII